MKPSDNTIRKIANNPYHAHTDGLLRHEHLAMQNEVDNIVKLELAAEEMVGEEVDLAKAYLREDAQGIWGDMKLGIAEWELITGDWLLGAADPTLVEWQVNHWWDGESPVRHLPPAVGLAP